jgi:hypothetical protein
MTLNRRIAFFLAAFLMLTTSSLLPAKTLTFETEKCHVDVPDDWTEQHVEGNKLAVVNADQTKSFVLRIVAAGDDILVDNAAFLAGVEKSMVAQGVTITNRQPATLVGQPARTIDATQPAPAGTVYNRMTMVMADGNAYALYVSKLGAPAWQDDQLNGIVNSFGFIGTPEPHHQGQTQQEKISELVGQIVGVFIAVLAMVSIGKWIRNRRK